MALISLSVKMSLADAMLAKSTSRSPLGVATRIVSPSIPSMIPETCLAVSTGSTNLIRASCPAQSPKSERRVSGRSMPGGRDFQAIGAFDEVSPAFLERVDDVGNGARQVGAIVDSELPRFRPLGHDLQRRVRLAADHRHAHEVEAQILDGGLDQASDGASISWLVGQPASLVQNLSAAGPTPARPQRLTMSRNEGDIGASRWSRKRGVGRLSLLAAPCRRRRCNRASKVEFDPEESARTPQFISEQS